MNFFCCNMMVLSGFVRKISVEKLRNARNLNFRLLLMFNNNSLGGLAARIETSFRIKVQLWYHLMEHKWDIIHMPQLANFMGLNTDLVRSHYRKQTLLMIKNSLKKMKGGFFHKSSNWLTSKIRYITS